MPLLASWQSLTWRSKCDALLEIIHIIRCKKKLCCVYFLSNRSVVGTSNSSTQKVLKVLLLLSTHPRSTAGKMRIHHFSGHFFLYVQNKWSLRPVVTIIMCPCATPLGTSRRGTLYSVYLQRVTAAINDSCTSSLYSSRDDHAYMLAQEACREGLLCTRTQLTETLLSNAPDIVPPIRCKQVPRGWCATEETKSELDARWQDREDARKRLRSAPNDRGVRRALKATSKQLTRTRAETVQRFFEDYVSQLEGRIREDDQFGFYKHIKGMDVEEKRALNSRYIKNEEGRLLRDNALIREWWVRWFQ